MAEVHLGHVGVQEKGPDGGGFAAAPRRSVVGEVFVPRVVLHHRAALELARLVEVADRADAGAHAVVGFPQHEGGGDEGFLVAFAGGALAEQRVKVVRAEDVIVRRQQERGEMFLLVDE